MGVAALIGADVTQMVCTFKDAAPLLVPPAKFAVSFALVYHYMGALRHVVRGLAARLVGWLLRGVCRCSGIPLTRAPPPLTPPPPSHPSRSGTRTRRC